LGLIFGLRKEGVSSGVGFAFSGAGGRIGQHLALMESIVKGLHPSGTKIRPSFLSGASSGSISCIVLNAILETEDRNIPNGVTWDLYKKLLFSLTNADIYDTSLEGLAKIFVYNVPHGYILDNTNLKKFLKPFMSLMNYTKLSDLYLPTSLSIVNQSSGLTERIWSDNPKYADLDLMEIVMSSTAMPIVFPPALIPELGSNPWIDGGTGVDRIPVYSLLHHPNVTKVMIICYSSALRNGGSGNLPFILNDIDILRNILATLNDMGVEFFEGAIDMAKKSGIDSYTYIPHLNQTFSALEFDYEKLEYELVHEWALLHDPTHLSSILTKK